MASPILIDLESRVFLSAGNLTRPAASTAQLEAVTARFPYRWLVKRGQSNASTSTTVPASIGTKVPGKTATASASAMGIIRCEPSCPLLWASNRPWSTLRRTGVNRHPSLTLHRRSAFGNLSRRKSAVQTAMSRRRGLVRWYHLALRTALVRTLVRQMVMSSLSAKDR